MRVSTGTFGFVGEDSQSAKELWFHHWSAAMAEAGRQRGFAPPGRAVYDRDANNGRAFMVGSPDEVADRLVRLHRVLGHDRHFLQMDLGKLPHDRYLHEIEQFGTRVKPLVDAELGASRPRR